MNYETRNERKTQNRVVAFFKNALGYAYLGNWDTDRKNSNIEKELLRNNLLKRGYTEGGISAALLKLEQAADTAGTTVIAANMRTYNLLRYPIAVQTSIEKPHENVRLIDWDKPENNDFALAEEVTLKGGYERRPDIVLYINGIAIAVLELKRSSTDVSQAINQLRSNQEPQFNGHFFSTVQLVFAGNDSQGLWYGTVGTPFEFFVQWKNQDKTETNTEAGAFLDKPLAQMCNKSTLLDLIRNFVIFDAGMKKVPRPHQYEGIKAAQERMRRREGGVIWHTQGSGKSILMVLLAKWIMEHDSDARILVITDRDELDKQIVEVMRNAGVVSEEAASPRITSRAQFIERVSASTPRLLCALIHKFDTKDLTGTPPSVSGRFYVFVDECHRTQGGNMNKQMKRWLPNAVFIGFTGTPLLKTDKDTTREVFGTYIHTYKFPQAVADGVVLDLKYEARDVPQQLSSQKAIDKWFEVKTKKLNNYQKAVLRKAWANMESLMSSGERKQRIIASIIEDFSLRPRLNNHRGTAILVAASIFDACHYFRLFQNTPFGKYCAIITSYEPSGGDISKEPDNSDNRYKHETYTQHVLKDKQTTAQYEEEMKRRFQKEPANCKLLIVVSKLLTGFDAPTCSYIYLDNELRDHNLFQAICRTNRLDGDDKDYGYIVDFKELFGQVQDAISVYSSDELDTEGAGAEGNNIEIKNWLVEGKHRLETIREQVKYLCEPVALPKGQEQFFAYFCGNAAEPLEAIEKEPTRIQFYKLTASLIRAYANIVNYLSEAGYTASEIIALEKEVNFYKDMREAVKKHLGEELDIKPYEGDMRHLINTYIKADDAEKLGEMEDYSLVDLIVKTGIHDAIAKKLNEKGTLSRNAIAEGIINNIRKTIIRDQLTDPRFYEEMSKLLEDLLKQKRESAADYEVFLKDAEALVKQATKGRDTDNVPTELKGNKEAILIYSLLPHIFAKPEDPSVAAEAETPYGNKFVHLALNIDKVMRTEAPADWRGDDAREKQVQNALFRVLQKDRAATLALFNNLKQMSIY